jgi:hypothetical protein
MVLGQGKRAIGTFPNRQDAESAINALKTSNFPMNKVSLVAEDASQDEAMPISQKEFIRNRTLKGLGLGALLVGTLGAIVGSLVTAFAVKAVPGADPAALIGANSALGGAFAGAYYGIAAGGIIGALIGNGVSREKAKAYSDRVSKGDYLVMVDGTDDEIHQAEAVLRNQGTEVNSN